MYLYSYRIVEMASASLRPCSSDDNLGLLALADLRLESVLDGGHRASRAARTALHKVQSVLLLEVGLRALARSARNVFGCGIERSYEQRAPSK